jgi:hypothetical protein
VTYLFAFYNILQIYTLGVFMKYTFHSFLLIFGLAALSGCSTWTADKCQSTNWDTMGYSEGANGKNNSSGVYASKCQKYCNYNKGYETSFSGQNKEALCSAMPDYNKGYAKGTIEYCTAETGYKVALDGGPEAKICTGNSAAAFMKGYKKGRKKFVVEEIANLKDDINKAGKDLNEVRDRLADKQNQLSRIPQYSYEPEVVRLRQELQGDVANLTQDRNGIKQELDKMESTLTELEREARN